MLPSGKKHYQTHECENMNEADLLKVLATPFRATAAKSFPLNDFIFSIAFDFGYCPPSTAQRLVTLGVQKRYITVENGIVQILFDGSDLEIPIVWKPVIRDIPAEKMALTPLPTDVTYRPVVVERARPISVFLVRVKFLKAVPEFIGLDGNTYGPFMAGVTAKVPEANAEIFVRRKFSTFIKAKAPPKKKAPKKKAVKKPRSKPKRTLDTFFK